MKIIVFTFALAMLSFLAIGQNAQPKNTGQKVQTEMKTGVTNLGSNYVDANNDGQCDNFKSGTRQANGKGNRTFGQRKNMKNSQGNRNCTRQGAKGQFKTKGQGQRINFVDTNNDGVCDRNNNKISN